MNSAQSIRVPAMLAAAALSVRILPRMSWAFANSHVSTAVSAHWKSVMRRL